MGMRRIGFAAICCLVGCSEGVSLQKYPPVVGSAIMDSGSLARPASAAKLEALAESLRNAFEQRDWQAVASHFSGEAAMTADQAEQQFARSVEAYSPMTRASAWYIEFDGSDYLNYADEGEVPIPPQQMRGRSDLSFGPMEPPEYRSLGLIVYLAEVDGRFTIGRWEWQ